jgi:hypothetical protein
MSSPVLWPAASSLVLVACSAQKAPAAAPAMSLYVSPWFRAARAAAEASGAPWLILSARHGVLDPKEVIEPYDLTLATMPPRERARWRMRVSLLLGVLLNELPEVERVVLLAGARYCEGLAEALSTRVTVEMPLTGKGIGQQLQWLKVAAKGAPR